MFLYIVYLSTNFRHWMCCVIYVYVVIMAADISKAEAEISELKDKFGQDCHIICDVGVFSHVISIAFKKWSVKLKFQMTGINQSLLDKTVLFASVTKLILCIQLIKCFYQSDLIVNVSVHHHCSASTISVHNSANCLWHILFCKSFYRHNL